MRLQFIAVGRRMILKRGKLRLTLNLNLSPTIFSFDCPLPYDEFSFKGFVYSTKYVEICLRKGRRLKRRNNYGGCAFHVT